MFKKVETNDEDIPVNFSYDDFEFEPNVFK